MSDLGRILSNTTPFIEIGWRLLAIEDQEISLSEIVAGRDGKGAGQAHGLRAGKFPKPGQYVVH